MLFYFKNAYVNIKLDKNVERPVLGLQYCHATASANRAQLSPKNYLLQTISYIYFVLENFYTLYNCPLFPYFI